MWSHNSVLNGWSECLSDVHLPHQTEPRHQYINTEHRPDITMFDPNTGQNLDLDVSLAHPWSQDIIRRASKENGHAAMTREEKKMKNIQELVPGGYVSRCVPLVIEHFGRWGTKAENFLQHLSQQSANPEANFNASMFMLYWRKRFSTILQRCNAKIILRKLSKLSPNHGDLDRLFDFDIQSQVH